MILIRQLAPFLSLLLLQQTLVSAARVKNSHHQHQKEDRTMIHRNLSQKRKATLFDASMVSEIQRRLDVQTATEFCSNLGDLETHATSVFSGFFEGLDTFMFLTENGGENCYCNYFGDSMIIYCNTIFTLFGIGEDSLPISNSDTLQLSLGSDGVFVPKIAGWCEFPDGSDVGPSYCQEYYFSDENPTIFDTCDIYDNTCPGNYPCEICEGGLTAAYDSCYLQTNFTCDGNEPAGGIISGYYQEILFKVMPDEMVDCIADATIPTPAEFCVDLSEMETTIFQASQNLAPELEFAPYDCACDTESDTFSVRCNTTYFGPSFNGTYASNDYIYFGEESGYLVPKRFQFRDENVENPEDTYGEQYEFSFLQAQLSYCEINGCGSGFCEICSDGLTIAHACYPNATCANSIPGSFLFPYKDVKLAIERCPPPTMAPVAEGTTMAPVSDTTTTPAPAAAGTPTTMPPDATMSPTESPTESSSSTIKYLFVMLLSVTVGTMMMAGQNLF